MKLKLYLIISSCLCFLFIAGVPLIAQNKSLNQAIQTINQELNTISPIIKCLQGFFADMERCKEGQKKNRPCEMRYYGAYACSKIEQGYYTQLMAQAGMPTGGKEILALIEKIDKQCKDVEIYVRLGEYKQDNFIKGSDLLKAFPGLLQQLRQKTEKFSQETDAVHTATDAYAQAALEMKEFMQLDEELLKDKNYNLNEKYHTGWDIEKVKQNIEKTDRLLQNLGKLNLAYPQSSYYSSFLGSVRDLLAQKRSALDDYNLKAKQSDEHFNWVYTSLLLNYYNNALLSFYNLFVEQSLTFNPKLTKKLNFVPQFEISDSQIKSNYSIQPFTDLPFEAIKVNKQATAIPVATLNSLNYFLDFINEAVRSVNNLCNPVKNFINDVQYVKNHQKKNLYYYNDDFKTPKSFLQKALLESKNLPQQKSLSTQAQVLMNILDELEAHNAVILEYVKSGEYKNDQLHKGEEMSRRLIQLYDIFDEKKEKLYEDFRNIYQSYPADMSNSWHKSGKDLLTNIDLGKEILFKAKKYCKGDTTQFPTATQIGAMEESMKKLITNQYDNMKGIERIGRNHGLCPYNPYEDIATYTQTYLEKARKSPGNLKPKSYSTRDPYDEFLYLHNEMVREQNRFAELAKVPLLKNVLQPEILMMPPPPKPKKTEEKIEEKKEEKNEEDFMKDMEGYAYNNMVFLLDVSSSMNSPEKIELMKNSMKYLVGIMRPEDQISIVVYSGMADILLEGVSASKKDKINKAIDQLKPSGSTNIVQGIQMAYKVAKGQFKSQGNNRIILATDGEFNISQDMKNQIETNAEKDIILTVFSFGKENQKTDNLKNLTKIGKGNYEHITKENANYKLVKEAKSKKL